MSEATVPSPTSSVPPPAVALSQLLRGSLVTQLIHVAAKLGIADLLRSGPRSADELAAAVSVDPRALYRVLRALASLGVFTEIDAGSFALTPLAEPLRSDVPGSLRGSAVLYGERWWWRACGELLHSVRTGQPAFDHVHGMALFPYLERTGDAAAVFDEHQTNMTRQDAAAIATAYDFSGFIRIIDVGGGQGALTAAILNASPKTTAILFDRPAVVDGARQTLRAHGLADRCVTVGGDFFESVPEGGDAYVLKDIVHDWDDQRAIAVLRNCHRALSANPTSSRRLLVVEKVIPSGNEPFAGKITDITMLLVTGGRERTAEQYRALLAGAGFQITRIVATRTPASVIEAIPV